MDAPPCTPQAVAEDFHEAKFNMLHGNIKSACIMAGSAVEILLLSSASRTKFFMA